MNQALKDYDEAALCVAIDQARELGYDYPWTKELEKAEDALFEMTQIPPSDFAPLH